MTDMPDVRDIREARSRGELPDYIRKMAGLSPRPERALEQVRCPHCGAPPMQSCTTPQGKHLSAGIHTERIRAAGGQEDTPPPPVRRPGSWPARRGGAWPVN